MADAADSSVREWMPASVPGCVQHDYARYQGWDDLHYAQNARRFDGLEDAYWLYRTSIELPEDCSGRDLFLVAKGIDYEFDILLNGCVLLHQEGMFSAAELDLTGQIKTGDQMEVLIYPAPKRAGATPHDREEADQSCKPAVSYGWDWHPYLAVLGIWDEFTLEAREKERITRCELFYTLSDDLRRAFLRFEASATADGAIEYSLYDRGGELVLRSDRNEFELETPSLWWCAGQGEPYLYTWSACLADTDSQITGHVGFRKIELTMNNNNWRAENGTRAFPPMTITLNNRKIFAKGSNWVNPEIFPGLITKDTYEPLVKLAAQANMNIFRCWGGAIVNKDSFFELCDEHGIMIWQEFPLACNNYVGSEKYLRVLTKEAESIVKRLRKYACVVLWCGGNELFCGWSRMTDQSHALRLLNKVCYEQDRDRPFLPTSPIMGVSHGGYLFLYPDGRDVFSVFQTRRMLAYTEFGVPGMPDADYIRSFIPEAELFPPEPGGSYEFHHAFNAWGGVEPWLCRDALEYYFGPASSLEELVCQSQWLQCEGYKAVFEEARRQKPGCSMAINWCYNEPWKTAANNSILSYPAVPKPAYRAVSQSLRDVLASARIPQFLWSGGETLSVELWLLNDSPKGFDGFTLRAFLEIGGEETALGEWTTGAVPANENRCGPTLSLPLPRIEAQEFTVRLRCAEDARLDSSYRLKYRTEGSAGKCAPSAD